MFLKTESLWEGRGARRWGGRQELCALSSWSSQRSSHGNTDTPERMSFTQNWESHCSSHSLIGFGLVFSTTQYFRFIRLKLFFILVFFFSSAECVKSQLEFRHGFMTFTHMTSLQALTNRKAEPSLACLF